MTATTWPARGCLAATTVLLTVIAVAFGYAAFLVALAAAGFLAFAVGIEA